jgi:hypothetical protein
MREFLLTYKDGGSIFYGGTCLSIKYVFIYLFIIWSIHVIRADNEPNQLKNSLRLDPAINSLNLVCEPNESNSN